MHSAKEKAFWNTAAFVLRTFLTSVVVCILLLQANGYQIDFHKLKLNKIGLLFIHPNPADVTTSLSLGSLEKQGQDLVASLASGQYTVTLTKPDYRPWQQTVTIEAGRSSAFPFATLYFVEPILTQQRPPTVDELTSPLIDEKLTVRGGELWQRKKNTEKLVTRYLPSIRSSRLFDSGHALVQLGSEIHIVDIDGTNDQVLLTLADSRVRRILPIDSKTIGLLDVGQVVMYRIR